MQQAEYKVTFFAVTILGKKITCIDKNDPVYFLFRDGTRMQSGNFDDFNCKGSFSMMFGDYMGNKEKLELLATKEIETIRFFGRGEVEEENFTPEQSKKFLAMSLCAFKKSKWNPPIEDPRDKKKKRKNN